MKVDLREDGLLWLINRVVFHPRGFALGYDAGPDEFHLLGDGSEPWRFASVADVMAQMGDPRKAVSEDDLFASVEAVFQRARESA